MKLLLSSILSLAFIGWGTAQIKELQSAQETRKKYIDPSAKPAKPAFVVKNNLDYVNPFIGTGGHGHTYPGASMPFGMVQLGPDTRYEGWDGCSGYHYSDSVIYGFSHTHLSGTGVPDLCDLLVVPQQGKPLTEPGYASKNGYGSKFSHREEHASPGLYEVKLLKNNIDVRLIATERCGMHEYTFNEAKGKKYILIDLDHRDQLTASEIKATSKTTITGYRHSTGWARNQKMFFRMELNVPFKSKLITEGNKHKMLLEFPESTKKILLKVGISAVDEQGAANNLDTEIPEWNFMILNYEVTRKWNQELGKIQFQSPDKEVMYNFYTALYHTCLAPTLFTDADGRFLGNDGKIYNSEKHPQYSVFSLWDTHRAAHPLYTLIQQKRTEDFIASFLRIYDQTKDLPVWELVGNETDCMIGYHSVSVILDAYRKGITNFNAEQALKAMITTSNLNEYGKVQYAKNGFLGTDVEPESVSKTLEYAYDDWCIAEFAKELGNDSIYNIYNKRSYNFLNIFDPETKFMRARRGGQWFSPFNPSEVNFNYTEANSWQYSLAAPQHLSTLRAVLGGKDGLQNWLDKLFTTESKLDGRDQADITGLIGQYAHGNEPSHHIAYLYNYTNQPYKTQEKVDQILREMYHNAPDGLSGNEDCGQMSAWYVLSAMGIYPVCPGKPVYAIGRPMQSYATLYLENDKEFAVRTQNNSPENKYIQSISLNGQPYQKLFITHNDIMQGGDLLIVMGSEPNLALNTYESGILEKEAFPKDLILVPYFTAEKRTFTDSVTTEIKIVQLEQDTSMNYVIAYTTDGSEPQPLSNIYSKPLTFKESTVLKAKAFLGKRSESVVMDNVMVTELVQPFVDNNLSSVSTTFTKTDKNISLQLETNFANQYAAGGKSALIDGLNSGSTDYRSGDWQGFQNVNAKGTISFEKPVLVSSITLNALQDARSWIFLPEEFIAEYSIDGISYIQLPVAKSKVPAEKEGQLSDKFVIRFPAPATVKSIRFTAVNRGVCPPGHISAGQSAWIFLDEITID